ncbi:zf-C3HC-domain-containing protein [Linderina pennispora]|uniref:Zf-C3HC-domain-containing protein n=1 Tax=Linderina pennispora TaxID=61395 RepID=A0A1Y1W110_9FUNG|nr:zf-C3HC-domain-containing protein [Linderina pennispora]ORX67178.1 zf-C3HC-domain-containing protein [Linderina pennispora]
MATASFQDLTKRRIETALSSFGTKRPRHHNHSSTSQAVRRDRVIQAADNALEETAGSIDRFRPWSRDDLLARIGTFKIHTWLVHSLQLSPVKCARNGWINIDCSTLRCSQCCARVIAQIPDDLDDDEEVLWVDRISQQLQSSHNDRCPWKGNECDKALYGLPLATSKEVVDSICGYAVDLLKPREQFPALVHPLSSFQANLLSDLAGKIAGESETTTKADAESALILALFGWRPDPEFSKPAVKCELCFRSVGLWLFQNNGNAARDTLNVADEHRSFCYWTRGSDAAASANSSAPTAALSACCIPGWQKAAASILRAKTIGVGTETTGDDSGSNESAASRGPSSDDGSASQTDILKKLRPFNISAISSAAEAFGIPFSTSMLAEATRRLASIMAAENSLGESWAHFHCQRWRSQRVGGSVCRGSAR